MKTKSITGRRRWLSVLASAALITTLGLQTASAAKPIPAVTFVDYAQCANGQPPGTSLQCPDGWINGILQASNSHYAEDQVTPQRAEVLVPAGAILSHTVTFTYQARKGSAQTHAYDSLATWNYTQTGADRNQGLNPADVVAGNATTALMPADPTVIAPFTTASGATSDHDLPDADRQMTAYGLPSGSLLSVSAPVHDCTTAVPNVCLDPSKDDYASITVTYTLPDTTSARKIQFLFGGHLGVGAQGGPRTWGSGLGASNISGGPYHIKWTASDGASIGNRDNQIMGSAILFQDTRISTQVMNTNGAATDTAIADGGHVNIGTIAYDTATLAGNTATAGGTATYYVEKGDPNCSITGATPLGTKTVASAVVPKSDDYTFATAGTYEFWVVYSGDTNNNTSTSTCGSETVIVNANTATGTTLMNTNGAADDTAIGDGSHVNSGTVVYDTADVTGETADAGGTVKYYYQQQTATDLGPPAVPNCTSGTLISTAAVTNGTFAVSDNVTLTAAGTYEFWAVYSGDTGTGGSNNGSTSTCGAETVVVNANTGTTTTLKNTNGTDPDTTIVDGGHVNIGTIVYDTADLTGETADAGGTVSYYYQKQTATDLGPPVVPNCTSGTLISTATVTNGTFAVSSDVPLGAAGTYEFWAVYSGDTGSGGSNNGSTSTCGAETVVVNADTATSTTLMNTNGAATDTAIVDGGHVNIGTVVYDTADLTGETAGAGGTVKYYYQKQTATDLGPPVVPNCTSGTLISTATVTNGTFAVSSDVPLGAAGTYEFWAVYSGDTGSGGSNNGSTSTCGAETVVVDPNAPAPHSTPVVQIKDTFSVTGFTSNATGNVLVGLWTSATCDGVGNQVGSNASFTPAEAAAGAETSFFGPATTTYYYKISYAGDANNSAFSSCDERVVVSITSKL